MPADGLYRVEIDPSGATSGTVSVQVYDVAHLTGSMTANGTPVTVPITTPGQNAYLTFTAVAGQSLSLLMTAAQPAGFNGSWYAHIRKQPGDTLVQVTSGCCNNPNAFMDTFALTESGTYTVRIDPFEGPIGTVTVSLFTATPVSGSITPDGTPVTVPITIPGQNGYLTFTGTAGQRITATMTPVSPTTFASSWGYVRILNAANTQLAYGQACCGLTSVFVDTIELPAAGTYRAVVDPNSTTTGTVSVTVTTITDVTGGLTIGAAAVPVTISTAGQRALLTFTGTAGQQATVRVTNSQTGYTTVILKRPDQSIATTYSTSASSFNLPTQTLVDGQYTIVVDPYGTGTGTLNIAVTSP